MPINHDRITYQEEDFEPAISALDVAKQKVRYILDDVKTRNTQLHETWDGAAADNHAIHHQGLMRQGDHILELIDVLNKRIRRASEEFGYIKPLNKGMWPL